MWHFSVFVEVLLLKWLFFWKNQRLLGRPSAFGVCGTFLFSRMTKTAEGQRFPGKRNACEICWLPKLELEAGAINVHVHSSKFYAVEVAIKASLISPNFPLGPLFGRYLDHLIQSSYRLSLLFSF